MTDPSPPREPRPHPGNRRRITPGTVYTVAITALSLTAMAFAAGKAAATPIAAVLIAMPTRDAAALTAAALLGGLGAWLRAVHFLGPIGVDRASQRWRIPPGTAARWLTGRIRHRRALLLAAAAVAAIWTACTLPVTALVSVPCAVLVFILAGSTGSAAIAAQQHDVAAYVGGAGVVALLLGLAVFYLVTTPPGLLPLAGVGAVAARRAMRALRAARRPARPSSADPSSTRTSSAAPSTDPPPESVIPRWELTRGAESLDAVSKSAVYMETRPVTDLRYRRGPSALHRLRLPRRLSPVVAASLITGIRSAATTRVAAIIACVAVPAGLAAVGAVPAAAAVTIALTVAISIRCAPSLESWLDSPALRRIVPAKRTVAAIGAPVLAVTVAFGAAAALAAGLDPWWIAAAVATAAGAHMRRWRARSVPWKIGPVVTTEMGAVPLGLVSRVVAGTDTVVLAVLLAAGGVSGAGVAALMAALAAGYAVRLRLAGETSRV